MKIPELKWGREPENYDEDLMLEVEAGVISYLIRGRNAWHTTWVKHWFRNTHLFNDVASAKVGAEHLRQRGNVFYIREAPALLLRGSNGGVVLCDHHEKVPFLRFTGIGPAVHGEGWVDGIYPGVSLRDAVDAFSHSSRFWRGPQKSEHSMLRGSVTRDFEFFPRSGPLQSLESYPQGSGHRLGWREYDDSLKYQRRGVNKIVAAWGVLASQAIEAGLQPVASRATAFVQYREQVLKATPRGVWLANREREIREREALRDELLAAHAEVRDRQYGFEAELEEVELELELAREDQLRPADTAIGIRGQRERVQAAIDRRQELERLIQAAVGEKAAAWSSYEETFDVVDGL
jgi:hypothetical protein